MSRIEQTAPAEGTLVYKIFRSEEWGIFEKEGFFEGSPDDLRDGFIHLSLLPQLEGSIRRHFTMEAELVIAEFSSGGLGEQLRFELSRGGEAFPHLYGPLSHRACIRHLPVSRLSELSGGPE